MDRGTEEDIIEGSVNGKDRMSVSHSYLYQ